MLAVQGSWATCDYNRIHDRAYNRKVAGDREGDEKFLTPDLEALWVKTEASFARRSHPLDGDEHEDLLARMDAETRPVAAMTASKSDPPVGRLGLAKRLAGGTLRLYETPRNTPMKSTVYPDTARRWDI
jgi:hypothetical protein